MLHRTIHTAIYYRCAGALAQAAPPACCDTLAPVLSTLVGRTIQAEAQAVAHLGETEPARRVQGKERRLWVRRQRVRIVW